MHKALTSLALASTLGLAAPAAMAHTQQYAAPLLGSSEVPAANTPASGFATVTIDMDLQSMSVQVSFQDLIGNVTAAHLHCCALPGFNAIPASQTPSFSGFPTGGTSGNYVATFDMNQAASYNPAFINAQGGSVSSAFSAFVQGLDEGKAYLNIHTNRFPGGEIRGLLAPVPEPATYALLLGGLAVVGLVARRRREP